MARLKKGEYIAKNYDKNSPAILKLNAELCAKASRAIAESDKKQRKARAMILELRRKRDLGL